MKKCYSLRWPCLLQDVLNRRLLLKQTGSSSTKGNKCHHFFVSGIGQGKPRCSQNLWQRENVVKTETANIRKWIARFYYFKPLLSAGSACVLLTIIAWVAIDMGNSICTNSINVAWVPSSCLRSDQPLSEGEIIPFSGVCQSGGGCIIHARRPWWLHALTDRLLWCATDDDQQQHHHTEHHFQL